MSSDIGAHPFGKAVTILKFEKGAKNDIFVDYEKLKEIFQHEKVKDRKVSVISIVGAFRKGKSFFLDYCLRYLYAHVS